MTEKLLHHIWKFQYFNRQELTTVDGEALQVIFPGQHNHNQGPDFSEARIRLGSTTLIGAVELHLKTSDWERHKHSTDPNYKNVVLHVVFQHDKEDTTGLPVLELESRISGLLLEQYRRLMENKEFIACHHSIAETKPLTWLSWKERLIAERLTRKSEYILMLLHQSGNHWEETFWWMIARNFGMKINGDAFESIARSVPIKLLAKHKVSIHALEAILLGQANFLDGNFTEDYPALLQREHQFYKHKYNLPQLNSRPLLLRMRPQNFPTIRLAQLAMLIHSVSHLFSKILETESLLEIKKAFDVTANDYWHYHYLPDQPSAFLKKTLGASMIDNIIINTIVPILFAYGQVHKQEVYKQKSLRWLEETTHEINTITTGFKKLSLANASAFDSQSLIELKTQYCDQKRCLECSIGSFLLRGNFNKD